MSIKALALELYRAKKNVDRILKEIEKNSSKEQQVLKNELKIAQKEWQMLRKMLDGQKESGPFQERFAQFSSFT
jgi:hypothetical protein